MGKVCENKESGVSKQYLPKYTLRAEEYAFCILLLRKHVSNRGDHLMREIYRVVSEVVEGVEK